MLEIKKILLGICVLLVVGLVGCRDERGTPNRDEDAVTSGERKAGASVAHSIERNEKRSPNIVSGLGSIDPKTCRAFLVGVDEYETLPPLEYASSDVRKIRDALLEIGLDAKNIRLFVSDGRVRERPSRERILQAFDEMLSETDGEATVLVALSGHGFETASGAAAFCPEDVVVNNKEDGTPVVTEKTAILMSDVVERLRNDDAQFKMLIVDACREPASTARAFGGRPRSFSKFDASGLAFLQSCGSKELSWEHPEVGGVFTHFFCEGLRGAAARDNGGVTFLDACGYASRETQRFVADRRAAEQTPFFTFSGVVDFYLKSPEIEPESVKEAEAERLYREGRALAFGLNRTKIDWQRGLELLTQAMEAGSMEAQAEISELFVGGGWEGARIDYQRAYELSAEPARLGNPFALVALGDVAYNAGYPDDRKEYRAEAFEGFKKLAEEGDVRAMNYLGRGFWAGWNGDVDFERAFEWTKKAADLGSVDAIANVGLAFIDGVGVERDFEQAKKYFREAAELNSAWAARALGHCYCRENNFGEAIQWLEIADKGNDSLAAVTLAELYDEGKGVEKDVEKATEFYRRGANLGNAAAKNALARRYAEGIGVEKSLREAERWFAAADNRKERFEVCLQAANEGEKWAPYFVGQCYEKDDGVRMDLKAMAYWYRRGAEMEDLKAMRAYAYCCEYGYGVKLDYEEMLRLYRKGAELGHGMSAVGMGVCYEEGKGVEIDLGESAKWYAQAMKSDDPMAQDWGRRGVKRVTTALRNRER